MKARHGYLYIADLNPRFGTESGKLRPVIVIQTDLLNEIEHASTWIVPCTTQCTGESILRVPLSEGIAGNKQECEVMIDQSRSIDNKRLRKELGKIPSVILRDIKDKIKLLGEL
jgi:mRNA interferase MazF